MVSKHRFTNNHSLSENRVRKSDNLLIAALQYDKECVYRLVSTESQNLWTYMSSVVI